MPNVRQRDKRSHGVVDVTVEVIPDDVCCMAVRVLTMCDDSKSVTGIPTTSQSAEVQSTCNGSEESRGSTPPSNTMAEG